jgi:serine/threonine protein kinase HipA of HipAB toxin-antitoxin module
MTPKQHQFAREVVLGKSQADAYRSAYNTLKMNDNSIRREASRLMDNPNVATTVVELQQKADAAVVQERIATREEVLQTLTSYMHSGEPRDSVRLRAAEMMGKHYGLFTDRIEAVAPERSAEEIEIQLEEKLKQFLLPETG